MNQIKSLPLIIEQLTELQVKIMNVFRKKYQGLTDWEFLIDFPKSGELLVDFDIWTFNKHGVGLLFINKKTNIVIDIHRFVANPHKFDVWRLEQYIESRMLHIDSLNCELAKLLASGIILEDKQSKGIYELDVFK